MYEHIFIFIYDSEPQQLLEKVKRKIKKEKEETSVLKA